MFPHVGEQAWIEKIYRPYMKLNPEKQKKVFQFLENINIHNQRTPLLTEGLPLPLKLRDEMLQGHYKETWRMKLRFMKEYPHTDPRDEFAVGEGESEARKEHDRNC